MAPADLKVRGGRWIAVLELDMFAGVLREMS